MKTTDKPSISVVIASLVGAPFIDDCLTSLDAEVKQLGAEVIVVACGREACAARIREKFSWVHVIHRESRQTVPALRRLGVEQAKGEIVAIVEEHCTVAADWLHAALAAHAQGKWAAVGGPVLDDAYRRLRDWTVYFVEYNISMPPLPSGKVQFLNGANIAYRRDILLAHRELLDRGYWEVTLHPLLLSEGHGLLSVPGMIVRHRGPFNLFYYLRQRYLFSRAYAGARRETMPVARRLLYLLAAPLLPLLLLARIAGRVWRKRFHPGRFVLCVPLLLLALTAMVLGEWIGYLAGGGDALMQVE